MNIVEKVILDGAKISLKVALAWLAVPPLGVLSSSYFVSQVYGSGMLNISEGPLYDLIGYLWVGLCFVCAVNWYIVYPVLVFGRDK